MQNTSVIEQAHRLLDTLPDSTTWEDLMYRIYVRQAIEEGLRDSDAGQTVDVKEVRKDSDYPREGPLASYVQGLLGDS